MYPILESYTNYTNENVINYTALNLYNIASVVL